MLLRTLLQTYPQMRGVLFDLPTVIEGAREGIASAGLASRCTLTAGDFFTEVPHGGNAYMLKQVIHNWDDARAITLLKNCRQAMAPEGRLLLIERTIAFDQGPSGALLDITVFVNAGAGGRTEEEYRALFTAAGFTLTTIVPTPSGLSIIEAAPVERQHGAQP
jgi:O-methyltransferase domain